MSNQSLVDLSLFLVGINLGLVWALMASEKKRKSLRARYDKIRTEGSDRNDVPAKPYVGNGKMRVYRGGGE